MSRKGRRPQKVILKKCLLVDEWEAGFPAVGRELVSGRTKIAICLLIHKQRAASEKYVTVSVREAKLFKDSGNKSRVLLRLRLIA